MKHRARAASCQQGKLCVDSGKMNKKYKLGVLKLLKIWKDYYLDASSVYYTLKKAHAKADGGVEYDICTYHARLEEALGDLPVDEADQNRIARLSAELMAQAEQYAVRAGDPGILGVYQNAEP